MAGDDRDSFRATGETFQIYEANVNKYDTKPSEWWIPAYLLSYPIRDLGGYAVASKKYVLKLSRGRS
jgi:hypothetical protein